LDSAERRDQPVKLCGTVLAKALGNYMIFPASEPAPLNQLELAALLIRSIKGWEPMLRRDFASRIEAVRDKARWTAAYILRDLLKDCEVLIDGNIEPPPFRLPGDTGAGVKARDEAEYMEQQG
jgi:hypothetical protein